MRRLNILCVQLGFHEAYPDASTLATTYNDGIYYVASFVQQEYPDARVEMCQMFWGEKPEDFPLADYDYILISALATHFWSNIETIELIQRAKRPGCVVIMGGPHAAFAPYEALRYADYAVIAEGEIPAVQLIKALEEGEPLTQVDNLAYIGADGELVLNTIARYGNIATAINPKFLARAPKLHWATVSMSRGCPFACSFCYAIRLLGRRFRTKTAADVRDELDAIYEQTGCNRFYVTDLNFTTRKDYCREIAETFRDRGYKFIAMSRVNHADDIDLVLDLKRSGFDEYCLGVESEDPSVLQAFNKRVDPSEQTRRLLRFAENDIAIHSAIIFGLDVQDRQAIEATARWCAEARIMHPVFVCLAEYPFQNLLYGARQDVEDHRIIMEVPTYQHYSFVGIFPREMRPSALQRGILDSYDIFFERAFEIETRPQRRARLKAYARSVDRGRAGMQQHITFLEELEKPYYTPGGTLREHVLKADFDARHGELRAWLSRSAKSTDVEFVKKYAR
ncbi:MULTISPECIES: B12-binding domain-containing radical SAM protein [unclassified Streptomyces]|uniref:B12-binding domain-containing radical SAM protein n=1 Tax=unclassified Streptomyces TaxID=2593676 RepID=UPI0007461892|nr:MULTISPECIES: radical SAM protein [unclassified Streptomyces]KUL64302.1 radical SAM protein [Streptomyces sp. NRRL S-1521]THC54962.1 radical SAM protein [Streptomyces sp. A1499]